LRLLSDNTRSSNGSDKGQVSPDGTKIAFVPDIPQKIGGSPVETVEIREMRTGKLDYILSTGGYPYGQMVFSPDGKTLAVVVRTKQGHLGPDGYSELWCQIQFWDVATGHLLHTLETNLPQISSLLFSPDSRYFALNRRPNPLGSPDAPLQIYDLATGKILRTLPMRTQWEQAKQFSADNARLATVGDDGLTRLWSLRNGRLIVTLAGLRSGSHAVPEWIAFTPDGYYVASAGAERLIRWRIGSHLYPATRYATRFRRPDLVHQALLNGSATAH
jgi:WD40 repeat protein